MQLDIYLNINDELTIPHAYQYQLQSSVYSKLREIGASDFWHNEGFGWDSKRKMFSFTPLIGQYSVAGNKLTYSGEIHFEVRSTVFEFIDALQRAFELNPNLKLFDTVLHVSRVILKNKHLSCEHVDCYAISPVVVHTTTEDRHTEYFNPEDTYFREALEHNFKNKFEDIYQQPAPDVDIIPVGKHKKIVIKYKDFWIEGYRGDYILRGPYYALEFLYNCGIGEKNSQGFGALMLKNK